MISLLENAHNIFFVGIKGQGMTALALVVQARGRTVSGSDDQEAYSTDDVLSRHRITVRNFSSSLPESADLVIYSTAYSPETHPQLRKARKLGIPILSYPEALGELMQTMETIAVAGSHGKTTTTAMIGAILVAASKDPTVIVGSPVHAFGGNARSGTSNLLVVEADEYQNKFQYYHPKHLVITSIEYDHPDYFPTVQSYQQVFLAFARRIPGTIVLRADDPVCAALAKALRRPVVTFGRGQEAQIRLLGCAWRQDHQHIRYALHGREYEFSLTAPGEHNAMNALAALALTLQLGVERPVVHKALADFTGVARRFDVRGEYHGAILIDDFAHHPTEVRAAISAVRQRYPGKRLIVVFQPHTYSRTKALLKSFSDALKADAVIVPEIASSARETLKTISSQDLVKKLPKDVPARYTATLEEAAEILRPMLTDRDVVLLLGAGDVWKVADMLQQ